MMWPNLIDVISRILLSKLRYSVPRIGKVLSVQDPTKKGRILCSIPVLGVDSQDKATWCWMIDKKGFMVPEVDDYVIIVWIDGKPEYPVLVGYAHDMKDMIPDLYDGKPTTNVLFSDRKKKVGIVYDQEADVMEIGKGDFAESARKGDEVKSVTADDAAFWTTFLGGLLTWCGAHVHPETGATTLPPTTTPPSNPGSITGKITAGSSQVKVGDK